jgi:hypothetical protein
MHLIIHELLGPVAIEVPAAETLGPQKSMIFVSAVAKVLGRHVFLDLHTHEL